MGAFRRTIDSLLVGSTSIITKPTAKLPKIEFKFRVGTMAYRDIDDKANQFKESTYRGGGHFTENIQDVIRFRET